MRCKLIGMNFDETLLNDEKKVTRENYAYLQQAREEVILIVELTTRIIERSNDV